MTFNSIGFIMFFPLVLLLYFLLPKKLTWVWLLAASYWFYMSWNSKLIFLILFTTGVSYAGGLIIEKNGDKKIKKAVLALTVTVCLGVLFSTFSPHMSIEPESALLKFVIASTSSF